MESALRGLGPYAIWIGVLAGLALMGFVAHRILVWVTRRVAQRSATKIDDIILEQCAGPSRLLFPLLGIFAGLTLAPEDIPGRLTAILTAVLHPVVIAALVWLLIRVLGAAEESTLTRFSMDRKDNLHARKVQTQLKVLRRILVVVVIILGIAAVLMNYQSFRQIGTGILASAGLAGLILGLAAQRTLANLLAGFQIAITQPIRLDDVVIVEGEWGRIEEITLTYVVVRIWDLRRLIVPISYFIEKPFQNWTRVSADILGTVYLHLDYSVPIDALRKELNRILEGSEHWDGKVKVIQVTDTSEKTMEVRALMSAADSGAAWDLRTEVREKLLDYLRAHHPESLPRLRVETAQVD